MWFIRRKSKGIQISEYFDIPLCTLAENNRPKHKHKIARSLLWSCLKFRFHFWFTSEYEIENCVHEKFARKWKIFEKYSDVCLRRECGQTFVTARKFLVRSFDTFLTSRHFCWTKWIWSCLFATVCGHSEPQRRQENIKRVACLRQTDTFRLQCSSRDLWGSPLLVIRIRPEWLKTLALRSGWGDLFNCDLQQRLSKWSFCTHIIPTVLSETDSYRRCERCLVKTSQRKHLSLRHYRDVVVLRSSEKYQSALPGAALHLCYCRVNLCTQSPNTAPAQNNWTKAKQRLEAEQPFLVILNVGRGCRDEFCIALQKRDVRMLSVSLLFFTAI